MDETKQCTCDKMWGAGSCPLHGIEACILRQEWERAAELIYSPHRTEIAEALRFAYAAGKR